MLFLNYFTPDTLYQVCVCGLYPQKESRLMSMARYKSYCRLVMGDDAHALNSVKAVFCWATGKRLTDRLPKLSLI